MTRTYARLCQAKLRIPPSGLRKGSRRVAGPDEAIAGAGLGQQVAGARRVGLELPAKLGDVDVQVVRLGLVRKLQTSRKIVR